MSEQSSERTSGIVAAQTPAMRRRRWLRRTACLVAAAAGIAPMGAQTLTPSGPVDFGTSAVGAAMKTSVLTLTPAATMTIQSVTAYTLGAQNLDYTVVSTDCVGVLIPPATCSITLGYSPTAPGLRRGAVQVTDSTGTVVSKAFLHGIGTAAQEVTSPPTASALTKLSGSVAQTTFSASGIVADGAGTLYFNDAQNGRIVRRDAISGQASVAALLATTTNTQLAIDGAGALYISSGAVVYKLTPGSAPSVFATGGIVLVQPRGVAVDALGNVYIADAQLNEIVRVAADGSSTVMTISGAALAGPNGLTVNNTNLFVANTASNQVLSIALSTGAATVLPGNYSAPQGVAVDAGGNVVVTDTGNKRVDEVTAGGTFLTMPLTGVTLSDPVQVLEEANASLVMADPNVGLVALARSNGRLNFVTPTHVAKTDTTDGVQSFYVINSGTDPLVFSVPASGTNPSISTPSYAVAPGSTCPVLNSASTATQLASGQACTYDISFTPAQYGANTATATITTAPVSGTPAIVKTVTLTGTGLTNTASLAVTATPATTAIASPVTVTVNALDASGVVDPTYMGTMTIAATDPAATYPAGKTYTYTSADKGTHNFTVDFETVGTFTVNATDGTFSGTSNAVQVLPVDTLSVVATPSTTQTGVAVGYSVTAMYHGAVVPSFTGTVTFSSSDAAARFLNGGSYTFTAADAGTHTFSAANGVVFNTPGAQTITATASGLAGTSNTVQVAGVNGFAITAAPSTSTLGADVGYTVTATYNGATAAGYVGTVTFTTTDPQAVLLNGGSYTFTAADAGTHTFAAVSGVQFNSIGTFTISGSDGTHSGISNAVLVQATPAVMLSVSANPVLTGSSVGLNVTVGGVSGLTPTGQVTFYDGVTVLGQTPLVNGVASLPVTLTQLGTHNLKAVYAGDASYATGTSAVVAEVVEDFSLAIAAGTDSSQSVLGGHAATYTVAVTPLGAATFAAPVVMQVSGQPAGSTVVIAPPSLAAGASATAVTVTVTPPVVKAAVQRHEARGIEVAALALVFLPLAGWMRRRRKVVRLLVMLLVLLPLGLMTGCVTASDEGYYGGPAQTYTLVITGTSGALTHSVNVTLTVQ